MMPVAVRGHCMLILSVYLHFEIFRSYFSIHFCDELLIKFPFIYFMNFKFGLIQSELLFVPWMAWGRGGGVRSTELKNLFAENYMLILHTRLNELKL